jgi:tetratricopeptide (TPR) repeat protein
LPRAGEAIAGTLTGAVAYLRDRPSAGRVVAPVIAIVSVGLFWLLRYSTLLLGDSRLVASNYEHAFDPNYNVLVGSPRFILAQEYIAKGTALLYHYAARISMEAFGAPPVDGIRVLNCVLGGLLVFVLLRAVLKRPAAGVPAAWALIVLLTSGAVELFFAYVENYTPLIFFGSLYVLLAVTYLRDPRGRLLVAVAACLALAAFMHVQGILLIPSFVFLLAWAYGERIRRAPLYLTAALAALTAVGAFLFATLTELRRHFLPALENDEIFGVLTPSHLADIANEIMLLLPMAVVTLAIALVYRREGPAEADDRPRRARLHFILLILFPCLLFLFVFKPDLGMARDWDLFAITALGLVPLCMVVVFRAYGGGGKRQIERLTGPAAAVCLVLVAAWVGVNASPHLSAKRFEAILEYDQTRAPYAYEVLAQHYRHRDDLEQAVAILNKGMSLSYNLRLMSLSAAFHDEMGDLEEAVRLYKEVVEKQPDRDGTRRNLVILLHRMGRRAELLEYSRDGTRYHPERPIYHYFYGLTLIDTGEVERGIEELLICRRQGPSPDVTANIDSVLRRLEAAGYSIEEQGSPTQFKMGGRR